jgi:hypothetical protein
VDAPDVQAEGLLDVQARFGDLIEKDYYLGDVIDIDELVLGSSLGSKTVRRVRRFDPSSVRPRPSPMARGGAGRQSSVIRSSAVRAGA